MRARVLVCLLALFAGVVNGSTPAGAQAADATITGTVTSADGQPLEGVCVEAFGDSYITTATASDGSYALQLEAGSYRIGFNSCGERVAGHAPEFYDDAPTPEDAEAVTVGSGETRTDIDAALAPTGSISGAVIDDESGEPLAGICVAAIAGDADGFGSAVTDENGRYVVADLPAGSYNVVFEDCTDPLVHMTEVYDDVPLQQGSPAGEPVLVDVISGEDTGGIDAGLALGGAITGTVLGLHTGDGQPLVCVGLFEQSAQEGDLPVSVAYTGLGALARQDRVVPPGEYTFGGVAPGKYVVAFNAEICDDDGYLTTYYDSATTSQEATVITVTKGQVTAEINAVVTPLPSISFACPFEIPSENRQFDDVPEGNVHAVAIECLALFDIVLGRSERQYNPAQPVTRAQLASFVARTLEASGVVLPSEPPDAFDDDNGSVHELRINQLAAIGVVRGVADRRYAPAQTVSRGQMATFLVNAYQEATDKTLQAPEDRFADDAGSVHEANINKAATAGITAGTGSGYAPDGVVRRDAMASFLARLLDRVQRDLFDLTFTPGEEAEPAAGAMSQVSTGGAASPAGPSALRIRGFRPLQRLAEQAAALSR